MDRPFIFGQPPLQKQGILRRLRLHLSTLSPFERLVFLFLVVVGIVSFVGLAWRLNAAILVEIPARGGEIQEGMVGTPRFINPLLATSDVDRDLTSLLYAGLMRRNKDGTLSGELAKTFTVSDDGLTYRFTLKDNLTFHDGSPLTAEDVAFTVALAQNPALGSPRQADFAGVSVHVLSPAEIEFVLPSAFAPFIENTTLGILPKHIWESAGPDEIGFSQFNLEPIGAGPYTIDSIARDPSGIALSYHLEAFHNYAQGQPHINTFTAVFYRNEPELIKALKAGTITSASSISAAMAPQVEGIDGVMLHHEALPRVFGVFFNYNRMQMFAKTEVRKALSESLDRQKIIDAALLGYGKATDGPLPPEEAPPAAAIESAQSRLADGGWKRRADDGIWELKTKTETFELRFTIATADVPELVRAAEEVARQWNDLGAKVEIATFSSADLAQNVIRPRKFDALLFGEVIGREKDLYPFWHSSQRNDPGLNIATYTNIDADSALERMRSAISGTKRDEALSVFMREVAKDTPAAFLFVPELLYALPDSVQNVTLKGIIDAPDRFSTIYEWYAKTDSVWPFLRPRK